MNGKKGDLKRLASCGVWYEVAYCFRVALRQAQGDRKPKAVSLKIVLIDVTLSLSKGLAAATR
ncbi:MAG TPA: hypothetical protein VGA96_09785 [Fibrella sp.]